MNLDQSKSKPLNQPPFFWELDGASKILIIYSSMWYDIIAEFGLKFIYFCFYWDPYIKVAETQQHNTKTTHWTLNTETTHEDSWNCHNFEEQASGSKELCHWFSQRIFRHEDSWNYHNFEAS